MARGGGRELGKKKRGRKKKHHGITAEWRLALYQKTKCTWTKSSTWVKLSAKQAIQELRKKKQKKVLASELHKGVNLFFPHWDQSQFAICTQNESVLITLGIQGLVPPFVTFYLFCLRTSKLSGKLARLFRLGLQQLGDSKYQSVAIGFLNPACPLLDKKIQQKNERQIMEENCSKAWLEAEEMKSSTCFVLPHG